MRNFIDLISTPARSLARIHGKVVLAAMLALSGSPIHAASITPLGDLPGGDFFSVATAVSADGSVVVGYSSSANDPAEAFRWTSNEGMVRLGYLPGGGFYTGTTDVSDDGSVVVGSVGEAFRWTSSGGMVGLGHLLPGEYAYSVATAVSAHGSVVVGSSRFASSATLDSFEAFRWTSSGGMVGLGDLPGGNIHSGAVAVSADGSVVVGGSSSANGNEAFRWTSGGGMVGLGDLPGGSFASYAEGASGDGSVVVGGSISANDSIEAFRWTSSGGMVGLGDLPGGNFDSYAWGVSADGSVVVGSSSSANGTSEAFRWTETDGMKSLWDVLLSKGVSPAADKWSNLDLAYDVSDDGRFVVGMGIRNGRSEAFLVDLQGSGTGNLVISNLEIPADGSDQAGVGIVSGWHCTASVIEVVFDNLPPITAGSRTTRNDTAGICGDADNGFSLLWAYSLLGEGQHTAVLYADGVEFARSSFNVTLINGEEFVDGASGAWELPNFPVPGHRLKVRWDEASQNFVIFGSETME